MSKMIWRWGPALVGFAGYYAFILIDKPDVPLLDPVLMGRAFGAAFAGLVIGIILAEIFGGKPPPPRI